MGGNGITGIDPFGVYGLSGKGTMPNPPSTTWTSLAEYQAMENIELISRNAELEMLRMQLDFQSQLEVIQNATLLPTVPEVEEVEDIDWTDKIAEMESDAWADIEAYTYMGSASGTLITSPLIWDSEAAVISKSLIGA